MPAEANPAWEQQLLAQAQQALHSATNTPPRTTDPAQ